MGYVLNYLLFVQSKKRQKGFESVIQIWTSACLAVQQPGKFNKFGPRYSWVKNVFLKFWTHLPVKSFRKIPIYTFYLISYLIFPKITKTNEWFPSSKHFWFRIYCCNLFGQGFPEMTVYPTQLNTYIDEHITCRVQGVPGI